jgi:RimJ/RimL family protein N-acetyltransferase
MDQPALRTERLRLRQWKESDLPTFAEMNADPRVINFFPALLSENESNELAQRIRTSMTKLGLGLWVVEVPGIASFIGFVGLSVPRFNVHFTPCAEIGWRLAFDHWGHGYATEAAQLALGYGFGTRALSEIVSFTSATNHRSRAVMERLGMRRDPVEDFDHPELPEGDPLRRHVLYRLSSGSYFGIY